MTKKQAINILEYEDLIFEIVPFESTSFYEIKLDKLFLTEKEAKEFAEAIQKFLPK
jgi:hypothetical protein